MELKCIVFVTSGQPSANPRLVKEVGTAIENGYGVKVVYCSFSPWADAYDVELFKDFPTVQWIKVGAHPEQDKQQYKLSRLRRKLNERLAKAGFGGIKIKENSISFFVQELKKEAAKHSADLYIGHNLAALPAAALAAKKHNAKYGFDAEDFHRAEMEENKLLQKFMTAVEDHYLPGAAYITAASPLIAENYSRLYDRAVIPILNCFSIKQLQTVQNLGSDKIRFFWMSQFAGAKRGMEQFLYALKAFSDERCEVVVAANAKDEIKKSWLAIYPKIVFLGAVAPNDIEKIAATCQFGLALELADIEARDLCLTNKIFSYLLAGNFILFSKTTAQSQFNAENRLGKTFDLQNEEEIVNTLKGLMKEEASIADQRARNHQLAKNRFNWQLESKKISSIWNELLKIG